jgi:S1-C subfamily serine protease
MRNVTRWLFLVVVTLCALGARHARAEDPAPAPVRAPVGYVGIEVAPAYFLDSEHRARLRLEPTSGIAIHHLVKGGPAHRAGVRYGDVLVRFAGHDVPSSEPPADLADFGATIEGHERWLRAFRALGIVVKPGAEVELTVTRDAKPVALKMVAIDENALRALLEAYALEAYPSPKPGSPAADAPPPVRGFAGLGLNPAKLLTPGWRTLLGSVPDEGVLVIRVSAGSPAATAGLLRGDVVKRYRGKAVPDTKDAPARSRVDTDTDAEAQTRWNEAFKALTDGQLAGDEVVVEVERAGKPLTVKVRLVDRTTLERAGYVAGEGNRF